MARLGREQWVTVHAGAQSCGDVALGGEVGGHGGVGWSWVGDHGGLSQPGLCYDSMALWSAWVSEQLPLLCREGSGAAGGLSAPCTGSSNAAHWAALRSSWALEQAVRLLHGVLVTA